MKAVHLAESLAKSIQYFGAIASPGDHPIIDKYIKDDVNNAGIEVADAWMALFKQETIFELVNRIAYGLENPDGLTRYANLLPWAHKTAPVTEVLLVENLEKETLAVNFPILAVATTSGAVEFASYLRAFFHGTNSQVINRAIATKFSVQYQVTIRSIFSPVLSHIFRASMYHVTWYLYKYAPFPKVRDFFENALHIDNTKDISSNDEQSRNARLALVLAAHKFLATVDTEMREIIRGEIAYFNQMAKWPSSLNEEKEDYLDCLLHYELHNARQVLIQQWDPRKQLAGLIAKEDPDIDINECYTLLYHPGRVNFWEDDGFGINVIQSLLWQSPDIRYTFQDEQKKGPLPQLPNAPANT
ncbi:hypothetical protein H4R33_005492 [Dimargaris cristalligena]|uniref:Uncharacterized protein n=1 Tax=Dimargaris cristalligena TaxID=215637 RepID=A0A4P9ZP95_9FUNG|nr:hypothetical protein H4R33_005492 [Dimargaris cristalligena]RKP34471.1 hypothetical protein BJ085DRAFT_34118 [Dimargaris cristalligena]|eukprot:RKP34471.1 hypothetical protein BJ085DRAFT_34118 [Dimargaris cristalligena]